MKRYEIDASLEIEDFAEHDDGRFYLASEADTEMQMLIDDQKDADADHRALVRELDVLLNGEAGAAKQASLCDIVVQVRGMVKKPVGYVHTMHYEKGAGSTSRVTPVKDHGWGKRGKDYDPSFDVTTQAVIAVGPITKV